MARLSREVAENPEPSASWHTDPFGRHDVRWWDGARWTEKVRDGEHLGIDPPGIAVAPRAISLNEPAPPLPSRRVVRLFGQRLPGAMLLAAAALTVMVGLVIVVLALVI